MKHITKMIILLLVAGLSTASCSKNDPAGHDNPGSDNYNNQSEKGFATGIVRDPSGKPMEGVKILANHHTWYNTVVIGVSDEHGKYKLNLKDQPAGSWDLYGEYRKTYNGVVYTFQIDPENTDPLTAEGGVRNLQWKLQGLIPGSTDDTRMGGYLSYYCEADDFITPSEIEFTLKPDGQLVDGSAGQTIVARAIDFPTRVSGLYMNSGLRDIPVGRYQISARHVPANGAPKVLKIKQHHEASFQASVTAGFIQEAPSRFQQIDLDLRF